MQARQRPCRRNGVAVVVVLDDPRARTPRPAAAMPPPLETHRDAERELAGRRDVRESRIARLVRRRTCRRHPRASGVRMRAGRNQRAARAGDSPGPPSTHRRRDRAACARSDRARAARRRPPAPGRRRSACRAICTARRSPRAARAVRRAASSRGARRRGLRRHRA